MISACHCFVVLRTKNETIFVYKFNFNRTSEQTLKRASIFLTHTAKMIKINYCNAGCQCAALFNGNRPTKRSERRNHSPAMLAALWRVGAEYYWPQKCCRRGQRTQEVLTDMPIPFPSSPLSRSKSVVQRATMLMLYLLNGVNDEVTLLSRV